MSHLQTLVSRISDVVIVGIDMLHASVSSHHHGTRVVCRSFLCTVLHLPAILTMSRGRRFVVVCMNSFVAKGGDYRVAG
jgi:hypothetical protein